MAKAFDVTRQPGFTAVAIACFVMLYLPIVLLVAYSFNAGQSISQWEGFSFRWYVSAWDNEQIQAATIRSVVIALGASIIATSAAVLAALATTRTTPWRGQTVAFALINQPLMVPEIVTAVSLLIFFSMIKVWTGYTGLWYLIIAHSAFCIPFAYMPIRARLQGMDLSLEQAGADLYGTPVKVFRTITLPQLWPGILAGAMLAFVISLDDVVITEFVKSAGQDTLPTYMLGQLRRNITPEINAISTALLAISVLLVTAFFFMSRTRK
ncbi:spermidine/putrescine ABC transporter permease [Roseivivax marinus]|uniref:Spermidine/putrescine transport system permease protein PotC n=1 Tax=Roseivivax marinus TaxID=1379903 RepID=W4HJU8_9RHOB|nr:ABC transporter permease [Roseivivax marinus]ETW12994.1 spermidine/putrescine ABC transporter permease [Roseivivax marinus]